MVNDELRIARCVSAFVIEARTPKEIRAHLEGRRGKVFCSCCCYDLADCAAPCVHDCIDSEREEREKVVSKAGNDDDHFPVKKDLEEDLL